MTTQNVNEIKETILTGSDLESIVTEAEGFSDYNSVRFWTLDGKEIYPHDLKMVVYQDNIIATLEEEMTECEECGEIGFTDSETKNFECTANCQSTEKPKTVVIPMRTATVEVASNID